MLIYPVLQQFDLTLPSYKEYSNYKGVSFGGVPLVQYLLWYLGEVDVTDEMINALTSNEHILLIKDDATRLKYANYINSDLIPNEYKKGKLYYENYKKLKDTKIFSSKLNDTSIFTRNEAFATLVSNLFNHDISPCLADDEIIKRLPKAYFVLVEQDELKDEGLIYSERLRRNGVNVDVVLYDKAFHGMIAAISDMFYSTVAKKMVDDLIDYLRKNV